VLQKIGRTFCPKIGWNGEDLNFPKTTAQNRYFYWLVVEQKDQQMFLM
jgi:hypothetical protein